MVGLLYLRYKNTNLNIANHVESKECIMYWENTGAILLIFIEIHCKRDTLLHLLLVLLACTRTITNLLFRYYLFTKSVSVLILLGYVIEVPFQPYIVNPLSAATQKSGKGRLI